MPPFWKQTTLPAIAIATRVGIGDAGTRWRAFTSHLGVTPEQYRQRFTPGTRPAGRSRAAPTTGPAFAEDAAGLRRRPARAHRPLLDKTGLTEAEHQRRTITSVLRLRELAPTVPIICVVTGLATAGYPRHVQMYQAAGIDLRAEQLVLGVGALVGRRPAEAADIIWTLYAAGLHRLHGFGVKCPAGSWTWWAGC